MEKEMKKKERQSLENENKKIIMLVIIIIAVIGTIYLVLNLIDSVGGNKKVSSDEILGLLSGDNDAIVYIENSDSDKCKKCSDVKELLDSKNIKYYSYDADKNSKKDYETLLQRLGINPDDFNYPGVIYINDGMMYSNIININDTKVVEQFIKDYNLTKVSK